LYDDLIREGSLSMAGSAPGHGQRSPSPPIPPTALLTPRAADVTDRTSLVAAFEGASVVVSLVGILSGSPAKFEEVQWKGVQNIIGAVEEVNAASGETDNRIKKIIHHSAIGADSSSPLPYFRTKGLAEKELFTAFGEDGPSVTVIRPSLIFGEGDGFFKRFATLAKYLPFLPVFGGGKSLFQPVFVGDIAHAIEVLSRVGHEDVTKTSKLLIQAGGPDVFTYRQMMGLVLRHSRRRRPIISLPFAVGKLQGMVLEHLPETIFTVTRNQIEQLKLDNIVVTDSSKIPSLYGETRMTLEDFMARFGSAGDMNLKTADDILPSYL